MGINIPSCKSVLTTTTMNTKWCWCSVLLPCKTWTLNTNVYPNIQECLYECEDNTPLWKKKLQKHIRNFRNIFCVLFSVGIFTFNMLSGEEKALFLWNELCCYLRTICLRKMTVVISLTTIDNLRLQEYNYNWLFILKN